MECVKIWKTIFTKAIRSNDKEALARILKALGRCLANISGNDKEIVEILISKKDGLLTFMQSILNSSVDKKEILNDYLRDCFCALKIIISFKQSFQPYVRETTDVCIKCLKSDNILIDVKKYAVEMLKDLKISYRNDDIKMDKLIKEFENERKGEATFYILAGTTARYLPEINNTVYNFVDLTFFKVLCDLKQQYIVEASQRNEDLIAVYLDCLNDMLINFLPYEDSDSQLAYSKKLYDHLLLLYYSIASERIVNKIICVLSSLVNFILPYIFKDCIKWLNLFEAANTLRTVYKSIPLYLSRNHDETIFLYFYNYFTTNLNNPTISPSKLSTMLYGLGKLSNVFPQYSKPIKPSFEIISCLAYNLYTNDEDAKKNNETLSDFLLALSEIAFKMPTLSLQDFNIFVKLNILVIKKFPLLTKEQQINAIGALQFSFTKVYQFKNYRQEYLYSAFNEGILYTCWYSLYVKIKNDSENLIYQEYLHLWNALLCINYEIEFGQEICRQLIMSLFSILKRLNLPILPKLNETDTFSSVKPENYTDFFSSLVALFTNIFKELDIIYLKNHIEELITNLIKYSYEYPMSGIYKLITILFTRMDSLIGCPYFSDETNTLISEYLLHILKIVKEFPEKTQILCIYLIFNAPFIYTENLIDKTIVIFKIALRIGLNKYALAFLALEILDNWRSKVGNESLNDFFKNIIVYTEPYFAIVENTSDEYDRRTEIEDIGLRSRTTDNYINLNVLQKKILLLYGSMNYDIVSEYIFKKSLETGALWKRGNLLQIEIPFFINRLNVYFDQLIPRLIYLIKNADFQLKFEACKLLQSLVLHNVKNNLNDDYFDINFVSTILDLGCDRNKCINEQLHDLILELIRSLNSKQISSDKSQNFIDLLFTRISQETVPFVNYFYIDYLKVFVNTVNSSCIISKLINLALNATKSSCIAAAVIFNKCYNIFEQNESFDIYCLQMFYVLVTNLMVSDDEQIITAIDIIESIVKKNSNVLNRKNPRRNKPVKFSDETLKSALIWLLVQCSSEITPFRRKCMKLVESLSPYVHNHSTEEFINSCDIDITNSIGLNNLENEIDCITMQHTQIILGKLDFYIWLYSDKYILHEETLNNRQIYQGIILNFVSNFVSMIVNQKFELFSKKLAIDSIPELIITIFKFIHELNLQVNSDNSSVLCDALKELWTDDFCILVSSFILNPSKIGLNNHSWTEEEIDYAKTWFSWIKKVLANSNLPKLHQVIQSDLSKGYLEYFQNFNVKNSTVNIANLRYFVQGVNILSESDFSGYDKQPIIIHIFGVFEELKSMIRDNETPMKNRTKIESYLGEVMKLSTLNDQPTIIETIIDFYSISTNESCFLYKNNVSHNFHTVIMTYLLNNIFKTLNSIEQIMLATPGKMFLFIDNFLKFARNNSTKLSEKLSEEIIKRFSFYEKLLKDNDEQFEDAFFNVYNVAMNLKGSSNDIIEKLNSFDLYTWIVNRFIRADNFRKKLVLFEYFLPYLMIESSESYSSLLFILENLRNASDKLEISEKIECFIYLMDKVVETKSVIILAGTVNYSIGNCKYFPIEYIKKQLDRYFKEMSIDNTYTSLKVIYRIMNDGQRNQEERLDALEYFLLSALSISDTTGIEKFYQYVITDLYDSLNIGGEPNKTDSVSRLICYKLCDCMYRRLEYPKINALLKNNEELWNSSLTRYIIDLVPSTTNTSNNNNNLIRLNWCAALNYCLAISRVKSNNYLSTIFEALDAQNILQKIVDCERTYDLRNVSSNYFSKTGENLSLESDDLNKHECMASITELIIQDFKNTSSNFSIFSYFLKAFDTKHKNIILYLLRIIINVEDLLKPYLDNIFEQIVSGIYEYLKSESHSINYLIKKVLYIFVKHEYCPNTNSKELQQMFEIVLERSIDQIQDYECNLKMIKSLLKLWSSILDFPQNFVSVIEKNTDYAIRIILIFFQNNFEHRKLIANRNAHFVVRKMIFRWLEPITPWTFQTFGWILQCITDQQRDVLIEDLIHILTTAKRYRETCCINILYNIFVSYPLIIKYDKLHKFMDSNMQLDDTHKAMRFAMFVKLMNYLEPAVILQNLQNMHLIELLDNRVYPCIKICFRIIQKLIVIFDVLKLMPYVKIMETFTRNDELLEYKKFAFTFFMNVHKKYENSIDPRTNDQEYLVNFCKNVLITGVTNSNDDIRNNCLFFWKEEFERYTPFECRLKKIFEIYSPEVDACFSQFFCSLMLNMIDEPPSMESASTCTPKDLVHEQILSCTEMDIEENINRYSIFREGSPFPIVENNSFDDYYTKLKEEISNRRHCVKINDNSTISKEKFDNQNFVVLLDGFTRKDKRFADALVISLLSKFISFSQNSSSSNDLIKVLKTITQHGVSDFGSVIFETLLKLRSAQLSVSEITKFAKSFGREAIGVFSIEELLCSIESNSVTQTLDNNTLSRLNYLQLMNLNQSISNHYIANSIFLNSTIFSILDHVKDGFIAQAQADWLSAKSAFEIAYNIESEPVKNICLQGVFQSLSELSSWKQIDKKIDNILRINNNTIWEDPRKDELLPWRIKAHLQQAFKNIAMKKVPNSNFFDQLDEKIQHHESSITRCLSFELPIFYLIQKCPSVSMAETCFQQCFEEAKKQWKETSYFLSEQKLKIFTKFRLMIDINMYLRTFKTNNFLSSITELINYWDNSLPEVQEDLSIRNLITNCRTIFATSLIERLKELSSYPLNLESDLNLAILSQQSKMVEVTFERQNMFELQNYICIFDKTLCSLNNDKSFIKYRHKCDLASSQYSFLCGEAEYNLQDKFVNYSTSWELASLLANEKLNNSTRVTVNMHILKIASTLYNMLLKHEECIQLILNDNFISTMFKVKNSQTIKNDIFNYNYNMFKSMCQSETGYNATKNLLTFVEFINDLMSENFIYGSSICDEFICALLTVMQLGSTKSIQYFPSLLQSSLYENNNQAASIFINGCTNVPVWMFLPWKDQIVSYLASPLMPYLCPIVKRLAENYPDAILYNFNAIYKATRELQMNPEICKIYDSLFYNHKLKVFIKEMEYLCQPEQFFKEKILKFIQSDTLEIVNGTMDTLFNKICAFSKGHEMTFQNLLFKEVYEKYNNSTQNCNTKESIIKYAKELCVALDKDMLKRLNKCNDLKFLQLHTYSPFLNNFSNKDINIDLPGQYNKCTKPLVQNHVKIARFDSFVDIVQSKSRPLKITIIGTNGKTYKYLVKFGFGENLYQDQRVQQIFETINEVLYSSNKQCQRQLSLCTYNVVPISESLGLIEWTNNTKSLKDFVKFSMIDSSVLETLSSNYSYWVNNAAPENSHTKSSYYKAALIKYRALDVIAKMQELASKVSQNVLRETFLQITPSIESFIQFRKNFLESYAAMCAVHYIIGVGDRRLEKTLVEVQTGRCIGIDFAIIFGTGVCQPIPELVPFRLTPVIAGLCKPYNEQDIFGVIMTNILKVLRKEKNVISVCLNAILHEPLNWVNFINEQIQECNKEHNDVRKWNAKKKLSIVEMKLKGFKPSDIMLQELSFIYNNNFDNVANVHFSLYKCVVSGNELYHPTCRYFLNNYDLSCEKQVKCLLDQATDFNVLGRMRVEWLPFV